MLPSQIVQYSRELWVTFEIYLACYEYSLQYFTSSHQDFANKNLLFVLRVIFLSHTPEVSTSLFYGLGTLVYTLVKPQSIGMASRPLPPTRQPAGNWKRNLLRGNGRNDGTSR